MRIWKYVRSPLVAMPRISCFTSGKAVWYMFNRSLMLWMPVVLIEGSIW
ncbi:MAG: hypothetical protein IPL86_06955 [Flavobacteriales bacterium]|nr:hypothetical protein [Flavobacteriales bacterium]